MPMARQGRVFEFTVCSVKQFGFLTYTRVFAIAILADRQSNHREFQTEGALTLSLTTPYVADVYRRTCKNL